jgi:hypothetical protein
MKPLGVVLALVVIWPLLLAPGGARAAGAALTGAEQALLVELLGEGVIGAPVAGSTLTPSFAPLRAGTWTYQIVGGKERGQSEQHVVTKLERDASGASWRYAVGAKGVLYIKQTADGSLAFVSQEDTAQGVISRYAPAEPGLLTGLEPGDSRKSSIDVKVYDLSDPHDVSHEGMLDVTYSYVGAYQITTPAGSYDAALIRWTYKGKVGPAKIEDSQYRFFAENVGMVASVDKLDVSALFVYHDNSKFGKLLAQAPE